MKYNILYYCAACHFSWDVVARLEDTQICPCCNLSKSIEIVDKSRINQKVFCSECKFVRYTNNTEYTVCGSETTGKRIVINVSCKHKNAEVDNYFARKWKILSPEMKNKNNDCQDWKGI